MADSDVNVCDAAFTSRQGMKPLDSQTVAQLLKMYIGETKYFNSNTFNFLYFVHEQDPELLVANISKMFRNKSLLNDSIESRCKSEMLLGLLLDKPLRISNTLDDPLKLFLASSDDKLRMLAARIQIAINPENTIADKVLIGACKAGDQHARTKTAVLFARAGNRAAKHVVPVLMAEIESEKFSSIPNLLDSMYALAYLKVDAAERRIEQILLYFHSKDDDEPIYYAIAHILLSINPKNTTAAKAVLASKNSIYGMLRYGPLRYGPPDFRLPILYDSIKALGDKSSIFTDELNELLLGAQRDARFVPFDEASVSKLLLLVKSLSKK